MLIHVISIVIVINEEGSTAFVWTLNSFHLRQEHTLSFVVSPQVGFIFCEETALVTIVKMIFSSALWNGWFFLACVLILWNCDENLLQ